MLPPIPTNIIHLVAIAGVAFLLIWWLLHPRSGVRGFGLAALGCAIILVLGYGWSQIGRLLGLLQVTVLPFAIAIGFFLLLAVVLIGLLSRNRTMKKASTDSQPVYDRCPLCNQLGPLEVYQVKQGRGRMIQRMCHDCAGRQNGRLVR